MEKTRAEQPPDRKQRGKMHLVTGGAGFIGSHLVKGLNKRGVSDILVVDDLTNGGKFKNLSDCQVADYMDKEEIRVAIMDGSFSLEPEVIFHQGACTDTMERDGRYMMENNFTFSKLLLEYALSRRIPFIYASSAAIYGLNRSSELLPKNERPLNVYGYSKLAFDQYLRRRLDDSATTVAGLRYFNVYGPRETEKGKMASMVYQLYRQIRDTGEARLFEGTDGFADGQQRRDFIYVEDLVRINLFFASKSGFRGIVNVGTGESRSFNDVANALVTLLKKGAVKYIPFDRELEGKYQSFTEADLTALRQAGYTEPFTPLEEGIAQSVEWWGR